MIFCVLLYNAAIFASIPDANTFLMMHAKTYIALLNYKRVICWS